MPGEAAGGALFDRTGFFLSRVGTAVQSGFKEILARWGIRPLQYLVLNSLRAAGGSSQQQLCRVLNIDSGNMVELLDGLEELGYARRAPDANDRRRHVVSITAKGRSMLSRVTAEVVRFEDRFFEVLDHDERAQLAKLLAKLYSATAEARGEGYASASASP